MVRPGMKGLALALLLSLVGAGTLSLLASRPAAAAELSGFPLLSALRRGGFVVVMRHASSPREIPDRAHADPQNTTPERQLDATGRDTATAMGKALREFDIPFTQVLASPAYRAQETVRLAGLSATAKPELAQVGADMQPATLTQLEWLRNQVKILPKGGNTLIVTHAPNISGAFGAQGANIGDGESLVFGSDGKGGSALLARIRIEDWPTLGQ
ncbi:MAG TPA: histidine phosphatase family protein [Steroidobacteraceae bacterium]|nr:histidine phosphatase family protein [Steroidobacteraceae bacterium]